MPRALPWTSAPTGEGSTRRRILDTARVLFAEHGYPGTSVRLIARTLGMSDPAVYYHFPTKQALYRSLLIEPEYGELPLDRLALTRENLVEQVVHLFGWWAARPEFGRMLLREQLTGQEASMAFMETSYEPWRREVERPLGVLLGIGGVDASEMLYDMMCGIFWDGILSHGDRFTEMTLEDAFQRRLRAMVQLAIPGPLEEEA